MSPRTPQLPTSAFIIRTRTTVLDELCIARQALERANRALRDLEDANERVPFEQSQFIPEPFSAGIRASAEHASELAISIQRKL